MGNMPFMRKVTVPERKCFFGPANRSGTGIVYPHPISVLILGQDFIYCNCNKFSGFITKPKSHRRNLSICIRTGNHLHRNIDAKYAFQSKHPFTNLYSQYQ